MGIKVFDFFSGCGGTSKGFELAGMDIVWAIDNDPHAAKTFRLNFPNVHFEERDIGTLAEEALQPFIDTTGDNLVLFTGCAPCQPYSAQNKQDNPKDVRRTLLEQFARFVEFYRPDYLFIENVPGLQRTDPDKNSPFGKFLQLLEKYNYFYKYEIVASQSYGIPQRRRRLVLIASLSSAIEFPATTHGPGTPNPKYSPVSDWIRGFPQIGIGEKHPDIPNHQTANMSKLNLERLRNTPIGGDRRNWPKHLRLACHDEHKGHTDVYGRILWDKPASCLTTKCTSISNGRFGHPEQDRAISAREAASLQTFPPDFVFDGGIQAISRQIGNAVPVILAQRFGENFICHSQVNPNIVENVNV